MRRTAAAEATYTAEAARTEAARSKAARFKGTLHLPHALISLA